MSTGGSESSDLVRAPALPGRSVVRGLSVVAVLAGAATLAGSALPISGLVVAVLLGAGWANAIGVAAKHAGGVSFAATVLLRWGIVALGLRLSLGDVLTLGGPGIALVAATVIATFFGTRWIGRRLGIDRDLTLLVATGYSICGASAIAAVQPNTDAREEHVAASIGLVTLFGTLALVALPAIGEGLGLDESSLGSWIGASTHDVAQVVAGASSVGTVAVSAAVVVKLTRVALLAPLVAGVSLARRRRVARGDADGPGRPAATGRPPLLPWFVVGFLVAVAVRTTGVLPPDALDVARVGEIGLLTAAMVGLGAGVRLGDLRALGLRPLALGAIAWVVVGGVSLAGVYLVG